MWSSFDVMERMKWLWSMILRGWWNRGHLIGSNTSMYCEKETREQHLKYHESNTFYGWLLILSLSWLLHNRIPCTTLFLMITFFFDNVCCLNSEQVYTCCIRKEFQFTIISQKSLFLAFTKQCIIWPLTYPFLKYCSFSSMFSNHQKTSILPTIRGMTKPFHP